MQHFYIFLFFLSFVARFESRKLSCLSEFFVHKNTYVSVNLKKITAMMRENKNFKNLILKFLLLHEKNNVTKKKRFTIWWENEAAKVRKLQKLFYWKCNRTAQYEQVGTFKSLKKDNVLYTHHLRIGDIFNLSKRLQDPEVGFGHLTKCMYFWLALSSESI